jgi:hypothetical protein
LIDCREKVGQGKHGKSLCEEHKAALKLYKNDIKAILKAALVQLATFNRAAAVPIPS